MNHFSKSESILLVGEGDFSFSACLANYFQSARNMTATSLDSKELVMSKYTMGQQHLEKLEEMGCTIIHKVDATKLHTHRLLSHRRFDIIVFNFPHAGYKPVRECNPLQISLHRTLMSGFFRSAHDILKRNGKIYVTNKTGHPYSKWEMEDLADNAGLLLCDKSPFKVSDYPGYINKRGDGPRCNRTFPVGVSNLYKFSVKNGKEIVDTLFGKTIDMRHHLNEMLRLKELKNNSGLLLRDKSPFKVSDCPGFMNKRVHGPRCIRTFPVGESYLVRRSFSVLDKAARVVSTNSFPNKYADA